MKITFNIDCTPTEARSFFGLPDFSPVNEMIVSNMVERTKANMDTLSDPKIFWEKAMAAGTGNMEAFQNLFAAGMKNAASGGQDPKKG